MKARKQALMGIAMLGVLAGVLSADGAPALAAKAPVINSQSVSAITQTSAILNATINPREAPTTYRFEYGTSPAYGTSTPLPEGEISTGSTQVVVGQLIAGLTPDTTYHFDTIAKNAAGESQTEDTTFTTLPLLPPIEVSTGPVSEVAQSAAVLSGTVNAQGTETLYEFDLGSDTSYGTRIFGDAGAGAGVQTVTLGLQGLAPDRTYHYRILASNVFGVTYGEDRTFTTPGYPSSSLSAPPAQPLIPTPLIEPPLSPTTVKGTVHAPSARRHGTARKPHGKQSKRAPKRTPITEAHSTRKRGK